MTQVTEMAKDLGKALAQTEEYQALKADGLGYGR